MTGTILTAVGKAKIASATPEAQLQITHVAVGDGNGSYPVLTENMVALANEVWRGTSSNPIRDVQATNTLMFESAIPPDVGGFTIREIGIFDVDGDMIAIGHVDPAQVKPLPTTTTAVNMTVRMIIALANAEQTNLVLSVAPVVTHNGLADRDMAGAHPASAILDASGVSQQQVNLILGLEFYVEMWGAKGDGVTSDIAAFTNAMNDLHAAYKFDGRPRTLLLQSNKTYIGHLLPLKAGVSIRCANGSSMIKRTPVPEGTPESTAKWWRVFLVDEASFTTLADISNRISLENFIIDGNMYNSQWTWNTYNQQQASCLYLAGRSNISINGVTQEWMRVRFNIQNVKCQNSVSDGLHVRGNVDLTFSNLEFEHCFRGGLTLTGGNSIIKGNNVTAFDARIDLEVDGSGIGGSYKSWIYLEDYWQDVAQAGKERFFTGGCDFYSVNGGVLSLTNVNVLTPPFNLYMAREDNEVFEKYEILNSIFHSSGESIFRPSNGYIKDTKIVLRNDLNANVCLPFLLNYNQYKQAEQDFIFDGLVVEHYDPSIKATRAPIRIETQISTNLQRLKFINCDFTKINADYTFALANGGRLSVDKTKINTPYVFEVIGTYISGSDQYSIDLEVGSLFYGSNVTGFARTALNSSSANVNKLNFMNTEVPLSINDITLAVGTNGIPAIKKGARIILGDISPSAATQAYKGDIYRLNNSAIVDGKPYEWLCTTTTGFSRTASTWKPTKWNVGSFATANLPVLTESDIGAQNIDTTLNKIVTWTGVAWI